MYLGSARVSRAGFGVPPTRTSFVLREPKRTFNAHGKVRDREDALASTPARVRSPELL